MNLLARAGSAGFSSFLFPSSHLPPWPLVSFPFFVSCLGRFRYLSTYVVSLRFPFFGFVPLLTALLFSLAVLDF